MSKEHTIHGLHNVGQVRAFTEALRGRPDSQVLLVQIADGSGNAFNVGADVYVSTDAAKCSFIVVSHPNLKLDMDDASVSILSPRDQRIIDQYHKGNIEALYSLSYEEFRAMNSSVRAKLLKQ